MEFYNCHITEQAIQNSIDVLKSGYLNQGSYVKKVEETFEKDFNIRNSLTTNSCTSALHIALELSNVRGKEVVLPAKTFIATGIAVLMAGGIPVFVDIDVNTGCPTFEQYEEKIGVDTAAAIGVSWGGNVTICGTLYDIRGSFNIPVIEDAAHSFGSVSKCRPYLDFTCYSFQAIKMLTCGDGGLLSCMYDKDYRNARAIRWFGIDKEKMTFSDIGERQFSVTKLGYKYNMNDLNAAILLGNMEAFDFRLNRRKDIATIYNKFLLDEKSDLRLSIKPVSRCIGSSNWLYPVLVGYRNDFIKAMRSRGVPVTKTDSRIDTNPVFGRVTELPNTQFYDDHEANLPCHENLTDEDINLVIESIKKGW